MVAEYKHPVLAPSMIGLGRRPELDFVVFNNHRKIKCAVESKWVGDSALSVPSILWDLIRLELVAHDSQAEWFFVLGGERKNLEALFANNQFAGIATAAGSRYPLLRTDTASQHKVVLPAAIPHRRPILKALFSDYQDMPFPHYIVTRKGGPYPATCPSKQHQVYAWHVSSPLKRAIFYPRKSKHYVAPAVV